MQSITYLSLAKVRTQSGQLLVRAIRCAMQQERGRKRAIVFAFDVALCTIATFLAFSLRVGAFSFPIVPPLIVAGLAAAWFTPVFVWCRVYSNIFRFAGARTIAQLAKAVALTAVPLMVIFMLFTVPGVPRTIAILQPILFFGMAATARIMVRQLMLSVAVPSAFSGGVSRVLIYGAGSAGQQLAMSLRHEPGLMALGFIDDDARLAHQRIDGLPVHHASDLNNVVTESEVDTILLALPGAGRQRRRRIVEDLRHLNLRVQMLPNITELAEGRVSVNDLREVQIEDLLGRDPVAPNELLLARTIVGKSVLVTGAGGSIGSELCRQICANGATRLVLFEMCEFSLYRIERELALAKAEHGWDALEIVPVLGTALDAKRLAWVFARWQPETVFHAAAYKHVPLVEQNPVEGMRNNVLGTFEVVQAAEAAGTANFTLVSSDKAVRPTNVMGATKRGAEQIVQAAAQRSNNTRFSIVRFGNVLGSSGSVVPLFRQQIEAGGPVTLTHRDVTRFFMTIPEAAQLVIQAGGMAKGGEIFVLDMGQPVRIYDLARAMVELSGLTVRDGANPDGDIEIRDVGLRAGEKLHEELLIGNAPETTIHPRIMMAHEGHLTAPRLDALLAALRSERDRVSVLARLRDLVPEFQHDRDKVLVDRRKAQRA